MRFEIPSGGELCLAAPARSDMHTHVQRHRWSPEAGGILLGRVLLPNGSVVVHKVTVPNRHDRAGRFRFFRAQRPAQAAVRAAWSESGGELNYLGEWHTHPEDDPTPSPHDRADWHRLVQTQQYEQRALFFVIVGRCSIGAWELSRDATEAVKLPELDLASGRIDTL